MSSQGWHYRAANGSRIRNYGQTTGKFLSREGHACEMVFQIADVQKVLVGVTPLAQMGNEVTLRANDGEIRHIASGRTISLTRKGGVYTMNMYFLVDATDQSQPSSRGLFMVDCPRPPEEGFPRPGA